jgi:hypothetical protein
LAGPYWFVGFDSIMELIAFAIAIAIAYQALKGYRLFRERILLFLNLSFSLLGAGLLIDSLSNTIVLLTESHRQFLSLVGLGYTINFITQLLAYGILVFAYLRQTGDVGRGTALAVLPLPFFEHNPVSELILIFLLVYIGAQTAINYSMNRTPNALLVFGAFTSLAVSHLFFLLFTLAPLFFPFAHVAQLFGFLLLLAMLLRVNQ